MLELKNIKKDYVLKDQEPVHALKGISLNFRANEFVAILGHSGCGKTTLLNITGGLDHYDSGDLIIRGVSTKDFKDRDWDTYRNHSIGFVFQTYNLIPHQSIIKNVELALTIAGISKEERYERAKAALDLVGLEGLYKKKPNQLSGGQMQRVAIARALVNNPEIVLADEPTGALDSETSVQIMDIMKKIADDHLVIMVTHNPELAEKYATRIVRMKDGEILSDSNPYDGKEEQHAEVMYEESEAAYVEVASKGKKKQSSMSFLTATGLSVSNLLSKFKRTALVAVAGSIGIIGVSTIIGVSCGVNDYIVTMENDMLSSYPISIAEESVDLTSLITGLTTQDQKKIAEFDTTTQIGMDSMINYLMSKYTDLTNIRTNDITETLVKYVKQMPQAYYSAITFDYGIDPTNNIFTDFTFNDYTSSLDPVPQVTKSISVNALTQRYIKTLMSVKGFENYSEFVNLFSGFMKQMPNEESYIMSQYDLIGGSKFATEPDEVMLVVDKKTTLTDLLFAQLGYFKQEEFLKLAKKIVKENELQRRFLNDPTYTEDMYKKDLEELEKDPKYYYVPHNGFNYEDVLGQNLYYYPHDTLYLKTTEGEEFVSHKSVEGSLTGKYTNTFIGIDYTIIVGGFEYLPADDALKATFIVLDNNNSMMPIANNSLKFKRDKSVPVTDPNKSLLDGVWKFAYRINEKDIEFKLTINSDKTPIVDGRKTTFEHADGSLYINDISVFFPEVSMAIPMTFTLSNGTIIETTPLTPDYYYEGFSENNPKIAGKDISEIEGALKLKIVGILRPKSNTNFGTLDRGFYFTKAFNDKYMEDARDSHILTDYNTHIVKKRFKTHKEGTETIEGTLFNAYARFSYDDYSLDDGSETFKPDVTDSYASALNGGLQSEISSIFLSFMASGSNLDTEKEHIRAVGGLKILETADPEDPKDEEKFTYTTEELPQAINIYPKDFKQKDNVTNYLDDWNRDKPLWIDGEWVPKSIRDDITYTDTISMIVAVISTLVNTISIALIAFTSLSLVVSCFMIAVITYISVMERIKEIGVIRSLGGRKKDVSRLFIAENLITGFASGAFGIFITYILQIIINAIVKPFGIPAICALPWYFALMMVGIAVALSVLSGLIPSLNASKQDPVIALRSE